MADSPRALVIVGATTSGKSELAVEVARRLDAEIISMDSRQVYRGMDIGTAKIPPAERHGIPHHGLDVVDPDERYNAGRFARDARGWIAEIEGRGRVPILVGGTGFFLRSLTHPLFQEPEMVESRRRRLESYLDRQPDERLHGMLQRLDPPMAARFREEGGRQRVLRALEIALLTGRPLSWWHEHRPGAERPLDALVFVLERPRQELDERIDARVDAMIDAGLVDEVDHLMRQGYGTDAPGMSATGYPEIAAYLEGERSLEEAADETRRRTRQYARRQLTWFRNQLPAGSIRLDGRQDTARLAEEVVERWEREH